MPEIQKRPLFFKILSFFNVLDGTGKRLSITNVLIYVITIKLFLVATLDLSSAAALVTVVLNYGHRRYCDNNRSDGGDSDVSHGDMQQIRHNIQDMSKTAQTIAKVVRMEDKVDNTDNIGTVDGN